MTETDVQYFRLCISRGHVRENFLEIGSARVQDTPANLCDIAKSSNIQPTLGVDLQLGVGVDAAVDFSTEPNRFLENWHFGKFTTVAIFNVLEHTFDPIAVLANALACLAPSGSLLVVVPSTWQLHNFPGDYTRLLPHWFEVFAGRFDLELKDDLFCWLSPFGITPIRSLLSNGEYVFPTYRNVGKEQTPVRYWISRLVHRLFDTYGRNHWATNVAIGATFVRKVITDVSICE
jgi:SAM-dependent methyltransferase